MDRRGEDLHKFPMRRIVVGSAALALAVMGAWSGYQATLILTEPRAALTAQLTTAWDAVREQREKSEQLERQLVGALKHAALQAAVLADAASQAEELAELHQTVEVERTRANALSDELDAMQRAAAKRTAPRASAEEAAALQQTLRKVQSLTETLEEVRQENARQAAALKAAAARPDETQQRAELQQVLQQERMRTEKLAADLAAAQSENEKQAAAIKHAAERPDDTQRLAELQQALQQEQAKADGLAADLVAARRDNERLTATLQLRATPSVPKLEPAAVQTLVVHVPPQAQAQASPALTVPPPIADAEIRRLVARGQQLIDQRDIGAARQVLERAAESDQPPALFALAETYDPNRLADWGTIGTQADVARARSLYRKALAGGLTEADGRLKALP